ncbi:hydrophobic surface binding protein A-domain-containing protein [Aspergillus flavus]|uniref:Hydrophobic surface binding protein A-domain-containing protein n=2 Tax=Aspergillus flavus TaxID=5059 RepID=A0A7U2MW32_ASPFN|nr:uncharacterized protein G4B84_007269 [Aspergillus flavus NRRL3357]KAB8252979.1 hypothetical protein BDV35DRAFT_386555 [Aspergillus flavus]KAF7621199.1 hypothetical protein AFLA_011508 [Aspergillus flavus NRRL3357]QMW31888.1 hypothetical protein G4B84_007269 [Aspergillus flavus NRRL3357]QMW43913.1 hypothetical protein G4B11_007283 [Aspergillus flavus]QRD90951.1 hydrophobic surface binding protein A-domain-containing protein [Aspergillus flavus]
MYLLQPLLTFLLLTLTTSTPIPTLTHDATAVINDLTKITTDLSALAKSIVAYNGGIPAALDIQVKEMAVERDLDQATRDTTAATPFTVSESATTTSALLGLEPDIRTALVTLVQKKPLVDEVRIGAIVRMNLVNLRTKTGTLSTALQNKATAVDKDTLATKTTELDAGFESAIKAYS